MQQSYKNGSAAGEEEKKRAPITTYFSTSHPPHSHQNPQTKSPLQQITTQLQNLHLRSQHKQLSITNYILHKPTKPPTPPPTTSNYTNKSYNTSTKSRKSRSLYPKLNPTSRTNQRKHNKTSNIQKQRPPLTLGIFTPFRQHPKNPYKITHHPHIPSPLTTTHPQERQQPTPKTTSQTHNSTIFKSYKKTSSKPHQHTMNNTTNTRQPQYLTATPENTHIQLPLEFTPTDAPT